MTTEALSSGKGVHVKKEEAQGISSLLLRERSRGIYLEQMK